MEISEFQDGGTRCFCWKLPHGGWDDLARKLDEYLTSAIGTIIAAYADKPIAWLELNYWPDSGRLIVFPSEDGPFGDRGERVCFQFFSDYMQNEFDRICQLPDENQQDIGWEELATKIWNRVGECLTAGQAHIALSSARATHAMRVAAFDYCAGEGLFRLEEFDEVASAEMRRRLADFKRRYQVGE
jgi:hypothetical protein